MAVLRGGPEDFLTRATTPGAPTAWPPWSFPAVTPGSGDGAKIKIVIGGLVAAVPGRVT
jgi:hypothetical protein